MQRRLATVILLLVVQTFMTSCCGLLPLWNIKDAYAADVLGATVADRDAPPSVLRLGVIGTYPTVTNVNPGSAAEKCGLRKDDIILTVGNTALDSSNDIFKHLNGNVLFTVLRNQDSLAITCNGDKNEIEKSTKSLERIIHREGKAALSNEDLHKQQNPVNAVDRQALQNYLLGSKYDLLEMELKKLQDGYRNGEHDDRLLEQAFHTFASTDPRFLKFLDAWVKEFPKSAIAMTARGYYYAHLGAVSRGTAFANNTPPEKFQAMEKFLEKAAADLSAACSCDNGLSVAFGRLIRLSKAIGNSQASAAVLSTGLRTNPRSYFIREQYLESLQPKWGGSLDEIQLFLTTFDGKNEGNPALAALHGFPQYVKADILRLNSEYEKSVTYYTQAINAGLPVYVERGGILDLLGRSSEAMEDYRTALALDPQDTDALEARGFAYTKKKEYGLALQDYNEAIRWDPLDPSTLVRRSYVYQLLKQPQDALTDLRASLKHDSFNAYAYQQIGVIEMSLKNPEAAKLSFKKAIDLKPNDPDNLYHYLGALYSLKECTIEIPFNAYLKACSTSDSTYCSQERMSWADRFYRYVKNNPKSGCKQN